MPTYFIPINYKSTTAELAKYFSKRNALSIENAIKLSNVDWVSIGFTSSPTKKRNNKYFFIKETDGKYWLDEKELERYHEKQRMNLNWFLLFMFLLVVGAIALPFILS